MANSRFLYGFLSSSSDPYNISIPWKFSSQDGAFQMNYDKTRAVQDNLICWANTNWGERPMRFRFGLDARRTLFEPINIAKEKLKNNTNQQFPIYFSELNLESLEILSSDDDSSIPDNAIKYKLKAHFKEDEEQKVAVDVLLGK